MFLQSKFKSQQECIPMRCVPPLRWSPLDVSTKGCTFPGGVPGIPPRRDLGPGIPNPPLPPEGTWDQTYPPLIRDLGPGIHTPPLVNRHMPVKTLPSCCWGITFDPPITLKAVPSMRPTAVLINIHDSLI